MTKKLIIEAIDQGRFEALLERAFRLECRLLEREV